jgi:hypothetical protein
MGQYSKGDKEGNPRGRIYASNCRPKRIGRTRQSLRASDETHAVRAALRFRRGWAFRTPRRVCVDG